MKKLFAIILCGVLLFGSCGMGSNENGTIKVDFPAEGDAAISWFDLFPQMEIVQLGGENKPMFHVVSNLIVTENEYYIIDVNSTNKVHRFDKNGKFLNSIGNFGRGPQEYLDMTDVMIDSDGNVCIWSQFAEALFTYSPDGTLLDKTTLPYATERYFSHKGFDYFYIGTAGWHYEGTAANPKEYKLYVTEHGSKDIVAQHLRANSHSAPNLQSFTLIDGQLYMCPNEGNEVYTVNGSNKEQKYFFDFGQYNMPEEFYEALSMQEILAKMKELTVVNKHCFWENDDFAYLECSIQSNLISYKGLCGITSGKKQNWKWYNWEMMESYILFRYLDKDYAYFIADPADMKERPELVERFPELSSIDPASGMVILKARTSNVRL